MRLRLVILAVALVVAALVPSTASASLHSFVPEGLPTHNAPKAFKVVQGRASADPSYAAALARQSGASSYNPNDYQVQGYSNGAPAGSTNSAATDGGSAVGTRDTKNCNRRSRMLVLINVRTSVKVFVCTHCANPRMFSKVHMVFQKFSKSAVVPYRKTVSKVFKICGSSVTITVTIKGKLRARTWGKVSGILKARLKAAFTAKVNILTKAKCSSPPPCVCQPVLTCEQMGLVTSANGSCVVQTMSHSCNSPGSYWSDSLQACVVNNCGNVVIINGDNNTVDQGGNCNNTPPPCTSNCPPPPCTCTTPSPPSVSNVTQPQEVYVGETYPNFKANVTSPPGDTVKVTVGARFGVGYTATFTSNGSDTVTGTYTAPTDLPFVWTPPSWSGFTTADTWEQVHVVATDMTTGLSSTSSDNPPKDPDSYVWFPIRRPPTNPA